MPLLTQYGRGQQNTSTGTQSLWDVGLESFLGGFAPQDEEYEDEEYEDEEYEDEEYEDEFEPPVLARAPGRPLPQVFASLLPAVLPAVLPKLGSLAGLVAAAPVAVSAPVAAATPIAAPATAGGIGGGGLLGILAPLAAVGAVIFGGGFGLTRGTGTLLGGGRVRMGTPQEEAYAATIREPEVQVGG